jgi:hypothetical protein
MELLFISFEILSKVFLGTSIIFGVILTISLIYNGVSFIENKDYKDRVAEKNLIMLKKTIKIATILPLFLILTNLPNANDLFKVRLALIKYELASPKNVTKGVETIERVAKKLECKYIGGCEKKKTD